MKLISRNSLLKDFKIIVFRIFKEISKEITSIFKNAQRFETKQKSNKNKERELELGYQ